MKINYKLLIAIGTMCALSNSFASDGMRAGITLGSVFHEVETKDLVSKDKKLNSTSSNHVGMFVGYDHNIAETPLFIGIEGELANHTAEKTKDVDGVKSATLKLATNNSMVGAIRLGVRAKNILIYGKSGMAYTNWKTTLASAFKTNQKRFNKPGAIVGAGIECVLNKNFSFGLEHTLTKYSCIEKIHPKLNIRLSPTIQATKLRLTCIF